MTHYSLFIQNVIEVVHTNGTMQKVLKSGILKPGVIALHPQKKYAGLFILDGQVIKCARISPLPSLSLFHICDEILVYFVGTCFALPSILIHD